MAKFRIETQITLLAVIIAAAVITSGYFAYKSLSQIVDSVHREARPDNKLFLIKDISSDLLVIENNVRLYVLSDNNKNLKLYDTLQAKITSKLQTLNKITAPAGNDRILVDSFNVLALEKMKLWQEVMQLHKKSQKAKPEFTEIYSKLEEPKYDTIQVETEKSGLLRKIFGGKKTIVDTTIVERQIETDEIKNKIQNIESEIIEKGEKSNKIESKLIAQNIIITEKINQLITKAEKAETDGLLVKTQEADRLAGLTYQRLLAFSITAVVLLLVVLFLLYNYMKKTRAYQRALKRTTEEAEKLALAKEQFAANVSHEMRTPVNAIYGLAEQLLHRENNDDLDEQISILAQSANHLNSIINDTLDFSKIQANKLKFELVHFSPQKVFDEIHALEKYAAAKKWISLKLDLSENIPKALIGDPLRLKQILINLVSNAIKFTDEGEVKIMAYATPQKNNLIELQMEVSDTGIGITKENQKIIFDEFVQAEDQDGKKYRGTGLGLSIVKKLVELQGGKIIIESEPGSGTTIRLNVPYRLGEINKIEEKRFDSPDIPESFKHLNILVADDEEFNRFLFKGIFKKWGVQYREATNGIETVDMALSGNFDIVLMDVRMPKKNGIEATKSILKIKPEIKIIAITATTDPVEKESCKKAGISVFLPKPFSEKNLVDAINSVAIFKPAGIEKPVQPQINITELEHLMNGDKLFMKEMILLFIQSVETGLEQLKAAVSAKDWNMVAEISHKIAPQCKHLRAASLYQNIKNLEKSAAMQPSVNHEKIISILITVEKEVTEINLFLKNYLNESQQIKDITFPPQLKN